jgi:hypothetical protein
MFAGELFLFLAANAIAALGSPIVEQDALVTGATLAPAAITVPTDSSAGAPLFPLEAVQLTEEVLAAANSRTNDVDVIDLFGFENNTTVPARTARGSAPCKAFPGDWNYPRKVVWNIFDLLLGGSLIKTTPVAAPCYKSSGVYDEARCEHISSRFTTPGLQ